MRRGVGETWRRRAMTRRESLGRRCSQCAGYTDSHDRECEVVAVRATAPPVANPEPGVAYGEDGKPVGRVVGWAGEVPILAPEPEDEG